jgi:hypothetical protein
VKVNVILADIGSQDSQGKLNLLGVGWSMIGVGPNGRTSDMAVAVILEVPWDQCNRELEMALELLTEDGQPVDLPAPGGCQPMRVSQKLVVPVPPGAPNGSPGTANFLVRLQGGLPLQPSSWYQWKVTIDGRHDDAWKARFLVRRQPTTPTFGAASQG